MAEMVIQTYSGLMVDVAALSPDNVRMVDIAWALSNLCRFNGHTRGFYSVAQHSVEVSLRVALPGLVGAFGVDESRLICQRWALLHDAAEAYLGDVPSPIKAQLDKFWAWENGVQKAITKRMGLGEYCVESITMVIDEADARMLATEKRDVLRYPDLKWPSLTAEPFEERIEELWTPERAYGEFMKRWCNLTHAEAYVGQPELASTEMDKPY